MQKDDITILPTDSSLPEVVALLAAMYREEAIIYNADPNGSFAPLELLPGRGVFLVARAAGQAIGTGAVRPVYRGPKPRPAPEGSAGPLPGPSIPPPESGEGIAALTAEVKRIYVAPDWRNRGVASRIMAELERRAIEMGYRRLVLETGLYQPAALRLYERSGFHRMVCWLPEDAADPLSVCFEKEIG